MLLTRNETEAPFDVLLKSPEEIPFYGREFWLVFRPCPNPMCTCATLEVDFYPPDQLSSSHRTHVLKVDTLHRTIVPKEDTAFTQQAVEVLLRHWSEEDWKVMHLAFRINKIELIENIDPENFEFDLPKDLLEDGRMTSFYDLFPLCHLPAIEWKGKAYHEIELYCVNPDCGCTDVGLEFFKTDEQDASFLIEYNYKTGKIINKRSESINQRDSLAVVEKLKKNYPDFDDRLAHRQGIMRTLNKKDRQKRLNAAKTLRMASLKIPRNAPCYCGSGKKYKQCHGK